VKNQEDQIPIKCQMMKKIKDKKIAINRRRTSFEKNF
jgi:hypothetical protein